MKMPKYAQVYAAEISEMSNRVLLDSVIESERESYWGFTKAEEWWNTLLLNEMETRLKDWLAKE